MFAAEWWWQGVWNSFTFLAWDLSMHPRTHIWFSNQFICTGECACNSNLNYAHKMHWKLSKCIKMSKQTRKITKNHTTLLLFYVDMRKFLKAIRGNGYRFVPKGGTFPTKTIMLVLRRSGLSKAYTQTGPKWDKIFTTTCWCFSMIAWQVSRISDEFWIY